MDEREREAVLAAGQERLLRVLEEAQRLDNELTQVVLAAEEIRREVEAVTGVSPISAVPVRREPRYEDLGLEAVLEMRQQCAAFVAAAELLVPLLEAAPSRLAGAVLKTCAPEVAARVREGLEASAFWPDSDSAMGVTLA